MVIIIALCFTIINHFGVNNLHYTNDSENFTILNALGFTLTLFRQIYYDVHIKGVTSKILFLISAVSTYLLFIHYTAYLTAASTSVSECPIKSFSDVIRNGYKVIVWENSVYHDILKLAEPGTPMHDVYKTMIDKPDEHFVKPSADVVEILHSEKALYFGSTFTTITHDSLTPLDIQVPLRVNFEL